MQTFLPFSSFTQSTAVLDRLRLGKQRLEAKQILNTLQRRHDDPNGSYGWKNHPAVLAWERYEDALKLYYNTCILTWIDRGLATVVVKLNNIHLY